MCKNNREVDLEIRTHPDRGWEWFENSRFWHTYFLDGLIPYRRATLAIVCTISLLARALQIKAEQPLGEARSMRYLIHIAYAFNAQARAATSRKKGTATRHFFATHALSI